MHNAWTKKLCSTRKYTGVVLSYGLGSTNSSYFTVHLKNVQHSGKNVRGYVLQSAHTRLLELGFCDGLYKCTLATCIARLLAFKCMP